MFTSRALLALGVLNLAFAGVATADSVSHWKPAPDLTVTSLTAETDGELVLLTAEITNMGTDIAKGFYVDVAVDALDGIDDGSFDEYIEALEPGESTTVSTKVAIGKASREVSILIDADDFIEELNESDNVTLTAVTPCFQKFDPAACLSAEVLLRTPSELVQELGVSLDSEWEDTLRFELAQAVETDLDYMLEFGESEKSLGYLKGAFTADVYSAVETGDVDGLAALLLPAQQLVVEVAMEDAMHSSELLKKLLDVATPDRFGDIFKDGDATYDALYYGL